MANSIEYDLVVVGAGMSGLMAAMAAKSESNRVLIIDPSNVLGGQGTTGGWPVSAEILPG